MAGLTGAGTPCLSITRAGDGLGPIAAHTCILILESGDLRQERDQRNSMPCMNEAREKGKMPEKGVGDGKSTTAKLTCVRRARPFRAMARSNRIGI